MKTPKPMTNEMWQFLLINAQRNLDDKQRAGLCFDLFERIPINQKRNVKDKIDNKMEDEDEFHPIIFT